MSDLFDIGVEAYIYGYPLVLMDLTRSASSDRRPSVGYEKEMSGGFTHATCFPDADFKDVVRPNNDTLYSMAWVDLREGPFVLSVEESGERYFLIQMLDMWTDVFASLGTRTTGNGAMRFLLTGPSWDGEVPEGMRPIRSPTTTVWMIARIQTNGEGDIDNVKAMQRGMSLTPVSRSIPGGGACEPSSDAKGPPVEQIMGMDARTFFETFAELMAYNTPHANDYPILHSMERVGIVFEDGGAADGLDGDAWDELGRAVIEGRRRIKAKVDNMGTHKNNWSTWITNIGTYGTDYLARAAIAHFGLGANVREDAIYPITFLDRDGRQLNGGERYVMHFDEDRLPPAKAFWSITMYGEDMFLADNPIDRYAIGDRDYLRFNTDGSLDIIIQHDPPGKERESNWLPAPKGPFNLCLRIYWPERLALDGRWCPPFVERVV